MGREGGCPLVCTLAPNKWRQKNTTENTAGKLEPTVN